MRKAHVLLCGVAIAAAVSFLDCASANDEPASLSFTRRDGAVEIAVGGKPFATYVYKDDAISRPYFAHLRAPGEIQVTRNHPPVKGEDSPDHDTFHPGLWMSFGDINGSDYWRLAAPVRVASFATKSDDDPGSGNITARFDYLDQKDPKHVVCHEDFVCDIRPVPVGVLLCWDSTFSSDEPFTFGDQEEMGLGVRVATAIRAERESDVGLPPGNGEITNSKGGRNEKEIWGETADWCDYSGVLEGERVGIAFFPHPKNFRPCWYHSRDYGFIAANPFGRAAFGKGEKSAVTVKPGETLRLRYGVLVHAAPEESPLDIAAEYRDYVELAGN